MDSFTIFSGAYACSGPGAMASIEANTIAAFTYAAFGFILVLATATFYFLRKEKGLPIVCFSLAVLFAPKVISTNFSNARRGSNIERSSAQVNPAKKGFVS